MESPSHTLLVSIRYGVLIELPVYVLVKSKRKAGAFKLLVIYPNWPILIKFEVTLETVVLVKVLARTGIVEG
jgi:hypothetical protein